MFYSRSPFHSVLFWSTATLAFLVIALGAPSSGWTQSAQDDLARSTNRSTKNQVYTLRYKMTKGETIRWNVEQIATTNTSMSGFSEDSSSRSRSTLAWVVTDVDSIGNMTFQNMLEATKEWQKVGDADPISYDSESNEAIPDVFKDTAEKVGTPLATITLSPTGEVLNRIDQFKTAGMGMGSVTHPLPEEPVAIGARWHQAEEFPARSDDGTLKKIKTRMLYTLREVDDGIATITCRREILTPMNPKIKSQMLEKMNQSVILFDIVQGRVVRQRVEWDEKVQGFQGDDSILRYLATYTKGLQTDGQSSLDDVRLQQREEKATLLIKPRDGKPILRN